MVVLVDVYMTCLVFFIVLGCYCVVNSQCVGCVLSLGTYGREHLKARGLCPRGFFSTPELFSLVACVAIHMVGQNRFVGVLYLHINKSRC